MNDASNIFLYLLTVEVLGLAVWPLCRFLFRPFPDQGWAFTKSFGILLVGWLIWFPSAMHVLPFGRVTIIAAVLLVGAVCWSVSYLMQGRNWVQTQWPSCKSWIIREEILFIGVFCTWAFLRAYNPDIFGLEKFEDYGFILSSIKTKYFPPLDHFLAGETINYYYYGHFLAAMLIVLSKVPANVGFNLQMTLIIALAAVGIFSITATLFLSAQTKDRPENTLRARWAGYLAMLFAWLLGNLHTIVYLPKEAEHYWYPNATRYITNTIHEFPFYSFIINDLHGHIANIPNAIFCIALLIAIVLQCLPTILLTRSEKTSFLHSLVPPRTALLFLTLTWAIGACYPTNAWDYAIYLFLTGATLWTINAIRSNRAEIGHSLFDTKTLCITAIQSVGLVLISILFFAPFWIQLVPPTGGVCIVPFGQHTPIYKLIIVWGVQWPLITALVLWYFRSPSGEPQREQLLQFFNKVPFFAPKKSLSIRPEKKRRTKFAQPVSIPKETFVLSCSTYIFVGVFLIGAITLVLIPEIIYLKDIYPQHIRANTMFKFTFQAWIWLGSICAFGVVTLWSGLLPGKWRVGYRCLTLFLIYSGLLCTYKTFEQGLYNPYVGRRSLDGILYLKQQGPGDYAAIQWLNKNIKNQPTVLFAVGDSYSEYGRAAVYTGLPTVLAWPVHEWLWRGSYDKPIRPQTHIAKETHADDTVVKRVDDVSTIYRTADAKQAKELLDKYHVDYVYVGDLEQKKYPQLHADKFAELAKEVVYNNQGVTIYRMR